MKIAVLYIALGRYDVFWDGFYKSCEKFFVPDIEKTYFVFTDSDCICSSKNVVKIEHENMGWPNNTLMRFDLFLSIKDKLKDFDYIFFFNGNMEFIMSVGHEVLPDEKLNNGLVMGLHPGFADRPKNEWTYERNPESTAYIPFDSGNYYVQGCLNGGTSKAYLKLCQECSKNTHTDLDKGIVAVWHDESHLNKYILDKNPLILGCNYLWPENFHSEKTYDIKIIQRDKSNPVYGGVKWLRGEIDVREIPYDIVICCADKDFGDLEKTVKYLYKNAGCRDIIVVSNKCPELLGDKVKYIHESEIMSGLNFDAIRDYFIARNVKPSRVGWYLQQFIKMAFAYKTDLNNYLTWDADTLMLNSIKFFDDRERILYDNSRIWQDDVFNKTVKAVLGYPRKTKETYIVEHMMMDVQCMQDLIKTISANRPVEDFWKVILDKINDEDLIYGGFSEFELIGTFMNKNYPDKIAFRPLRSNRNAANIVGTKPNKYDFRFLEKNYDFVSFEKTHKIQIGKTRILKNKIRNFFKCFNK